MTHLTESDFAALWLDNGQTHMLDTWLDHLEHCEVCLDRLSQWEEGRSFPDLRVPDVVEATPVFQQKLMRRINREETSQSLARFFFKDLVSALVVLFRPLKTASKQTGDER